MSALLLTWEAFGVVWNRMKETRRRHPAGLDISRLRRESSSCALPGRAKSHIRVIVVALTACFVAVLASPPDEPERDWGQDVLIGRTGSVPSLGKLVTDADTNGDIYIGVLDPGPGFEDTVTVWRSSDGGFTWQPWYRYRGDQLRGGVRDCELRVGHDQNGTWLYNFVVFEGGDSSGLWVLRRRPTTLDSEFVPMVLGDTILRVAADRNIESPEHLFVAWETEGGLVNVMSSVDSGQSWGNLRTAFVQSERPALCAGGDGCVYVAANSRDSAWIWIKRYTGNLTGPDTAIAKLDSSADRRVWNVSIAADRETPCSLQTAVAMYSHKDSVGRIAPHFGWTTNGGNDWQYSIWPVTNQNRNTWDARFPCLRRSYDDNLIRAIVTMHEQSVNADTLVYAFTSPGTPTLWDQRATRNDYRAADDIGAVLGFSRVCMGGYIAYMRHQSTEAYFDGYCFLGTPEPGQHVADLARSTTIVSGSNWTCRWSQSWRCFARVALFDGTGRRVAEVFSGTLDAGANAVTVTTAVLPAGRYYLVIASVGGIHVEGFSRLR